MKLSTVTIALSMASTASAQRLGFAGNIGNQQEFNKFESLSVQDRILEVTKNIWPECMNNGPLNDADNCKAHIDQELAAMNLSVPIESIIIYSRSANSPTAHALVIPTDDNGMCVGKYGDGRLFYEFDWCINSKTPLTDPVKIAASRSLLQPTRWSILNHAQNDYDCSAVDPNGDLTTWHEDVLDNVGGHFEVACSTEAGMTKMQDTIAAGPVIDNGCTKLDPIDCLGLSGVDTCRMIKAMVPWPNNEDENMECFLQYLPGSTKHLEIQDDLVNWGEPPATKVVIYAKYETKKVMSSPIMKGPRATIGSA